MDTGEDIEKAIRHVFTAMESRRPEVKALAAIVAERILDTIMAEMIGEQKWHYRSCRTAAYINALARLEMTNAMALVIPDLGEIEESNLSGWFTRRGVPFSVSMMKRCAKDMPFVVLYEGNCFRVPEPMEPWTVKESRDWVKGFMGIDIPEGDES